MPLPSPLHAGRSAILSTFRFCAMFAAVSPSGVFMGWGPDEYQTVKTLSEHSLVMNPSDWANCPRRGTVLLGWTLSPALSELAPPVLAHSGLKGSIAWTNNKPVIGGRLSLWQGMNSPAGLAQKLNAFSTDIHSGKFVWLVQQNLNPIADTSTTWRFTNNSEGWRLGHKGGPYDTARWSGFDGKPLGERLRVSRSRAGWDRTK